MRITIQDLNPHIAYFAIPDCKIPYDLGDKLRVASFSQVIKEIEGTKKADHF